MKIVRIHSFLVNPDKGVAKPNLIKGSSVPLSGRLFNMLHGVFEKAPLECDTDIAFEPEGGRQLNACRSLLLDYLKTPNKANGTAIASRLASYTTNRSGLGLLFLMAGKKGTTNRLVVSRFPADNAILAEEVGSSLSVKFLEKVFMRSATAYKSAMFEGSSFSSDFWDGRAVDKQHANDPSAVSLYWINHFLAADFKLTGPNGTRRLAIALKKAVKHSPDLTVKEEFVAVGKLLPGLSGKSISCEDVASQYHLSDEARDLLKAAVGREDLYKEKFKFTKIEFVKHVSYQSVELDSGGVLTADSEKFDEIFVRETEDDSTEVTYTARGNVVNRRLRSDK